MKLETCRNGCEATAGLTNLNLKFTQVFPSAPDNLPSSALKPISLPSSA
jgi:hypothetical protein